VIRSIWFYADSFTPVDPKLSKAIEEGYTSVRAWSSTYSDELSSALSLGQDAEQKLRWKVREDDQGREVFFVNASEAWIVPPVGMVQGLFGSKRVLKDILDRGKGGIKIIRGFDNLSIKEDEISNKEAIKYTDLILVIHGIGQKLSERSIFFTCLD
jgi:hypothetical protein